jgi:molybdate transport system substrate-binding protein
MALKRMQCSCVAVAILVSCAPASDAAELKVLSPVAMRGAMTEIAGQFEKASGHKLLVDFATAGAVTLRIEGGEPAEVAISSKAQVEGLESKGKFVPGTRASVARVGLALFVKAGAPKPVIDTVPDFKKVMNAAQSIGYGDPAAGGVSGVHMARVMERLSLGELQSKIALFPDSQAVMMAVAKGKTEIGFGLMSDASLVPGVELAAPLPADVQNFTEYAAAVVHGAKEEAAAREFVKYLSSPAAQEAWKGNGFQPR